jgi:hypothetical protein
MAKKWIQGAITHPGALRATAKSEGLVKGDAPLSQSALDKLRASKNPTTRKRASLAETLKGLSRSRHTVG